MEKSLHEIQGFVLGIADPKFYQFLKEKIAIHKILSVEALPSAPCSANSYIYTFAICNP